MARPLRSSRAVLKSALNSSRLAGVSEGAELLFFKLLLAVDDEGRFWGSGHQVLSRAMTHRSEHGQVTSEDVDSRLAELESVGLIHRYRTDAGQFLELSTYWQPKNRGRQIVQFPAPEGPPQDSAGAGPQEVGTLASPKWGHERPHSGDIVAAKEVTEDQPIAPAVIAGPNPAYGLDGWWRGTQQTIADFERRNVIDGDTAALVLEICRVRLDSAENRRMLYLPKEPTGWLGFCKIVAGDLELSRQALDAMRTRGGADFLAHLRFLKENEQKTAKETGGNQLDGFLAGVALGLAGDE